MKMAGLKAKDSLRKGFGVVNGKTTTKMELLFP